VEMRGDSIFLNTLIRVKNLCNYNNANFSAILLDELSENC